MPQKERCELHTGTKIKELRKLNGWTQEELGEKLGVKKSAIQKYEKGEIVNLKLATIKKLCEIFQMPPAKLIFPEAEEFDKKFDLNRLSFEVKVIEEIETLYGSQTIEIIHNFTKLNEKGKNHALEIMEDLTLITKYSI